MLTSFPQDIPSKRLFSQQISQQNINTPGDIVHWFGAIQAQDYLGALWAIGLRMKQDVTEADIENAIIEKQFVRTWPMRGTLHFVSPRDIRWMLQLMASRVIAGSAGRYRQLDLNAETFTRCRKIAIKALEGGKQITRPELYKLWEDAGVYVATTPMGSRGLHILGSLAMEGLLCFGPRDGKQQTFVLLDEWLPATKPLSRDEALAEITYRYFSSHGPATLQDFVWWTGLTQADAKRGIESVRHRVKEKIINKQLYWFTETTHITTADHGEAYILPAFDEYTVSYKDRVSIIDPSFSKRVNNGGGMLNPVVVINGNVCGTWKRTLKKNTVTIKLFPFATFDAQKFKAIKYAAERYGRFLNRTAEVTI